MHSLDAVLGTWAASRTIVDHRAGETYAFIGEAVQTRSGFNEAGKVRIGDRLLDSARAYRFVVGDPDIQVLYRDGSSFVSLRLLGRQSVRHACGDDLYVGRLLFRHAGKWAEFWRVLAPRKHYSSLTVYSRPIAGRDNLAEQG